MQDEKTIVIFRRWRKNPRTIIALFPTVPDDYTGGYCGSFEHEGQHGGADYQGVIRATVPASAGESAELRAELMQAPYCYNLDVRRRASSAMHSKRREAARKYR